MAEIPNPLASSKRRAASAATILAKSQELAIQSGKIDVGLSWEFFSGTPVVDLDASAVLFDMTGGVRDAVFYNNLSALNGAVTHSGDCRRGERTGYDEVISIDFDKLTSISVIVFVLSAYSGGVLKDCESAFCEVKQGETVVGTVNAGAVDTGDRTSLILAILFKHPDKRTWHLGRIVEPVPGRHFVGCMLPLRAFVDAVLDPGCLGERVLSKDKTFRMEKGDQFTLPADLKEINLGLGWTPYSGGLDLDASCILLKDADGDGDLDPWKIVYFGNKTEAGVMSKGDNTTGAGSGDDETICVNFANIDPSVSALAFVVNIYTTGGSFKNIKDSYVRMYDPNSRHEYARLTLDNRYTKSGVVFCVIYRGQGPNTPWTVLAVGESCDGRRATEVGCALWDNPNAAPSTGPPESGTWDRSRAPTSASATSGNNGGDGCCILA